MNYHTDDDRTVGVRAHDVEENGSGDVFRAFVEQRYPLVYCSFMKCELNR